LGFIKFQKAIDKLQTSLLLAGNDPNPISKTPGS
jgi:hypothetical protein